MRIPTLMVACGATLVSLVGTLEAQQWGNLTMTFTYDGAPPAAPSVVVTKDEAFCGRFGLVDESLLVNKENRGVQNVVAHLYLARGQSKPAIHPDYAASASEQVKLDNNECRFSPRVRLLRTTQKLSVLNSDTVGHNTNFTTFSNPGQNVLIPAGGQVEMSFGSEERRPSPVACNIHPWMKGWLIVREDPYMGFSDENGKVTIQNIPAGDWTFQLWHETAGYVASATQNGKALTIPRGRLEVTIKPGENDLGEFKLPPSLFQ